MRTWLSTWKIKIHLSKDGGGWGARGRGSFSVFSCSMQNSKKKSLSLWLKDGSTWATPLIPFPCLPCLSPMQTLGGSGREREREPCLVPAVSGGTVHPRVPRQCQEPFFQEPQCPVGLGWWGGVGQDGVGQREREPLRESQGVKIADGNWGREGVRRWVQSPACLHR